MSKETSKTVTVACKIPNGLDLRIGDFVEVTEHSPSGSVVTKQWRPRPGFVRIAGPGRRVGEDPTAPIAHGAALTFGVDREIFERWLEENKESDLVRNNLIFAAENRTEVSAQAREMVGELSGLEPLTPDKDQRVPKRVKSMNRDEAA